MGFCHAVWTRLASTVKTKAPRRPQKRPGPCWKWLMAGPVTLASKRKEEPSTCSPTRKPSEASMAMRPWVILMSAYFLPGWILTEPVVAALATTLRAQMQAMMFVCVLGEKIMGTKLDLTYVPDEEDDM